MISSVKILVVDDESRMRKLVHDFLAKKGYEVLEAANGREAVDLFFDTNDISLIILDVMMPIVINKAAHEVTVDGEPIEVSYKEFELLSYFMENQGVALSRERILNKVWNYDYYGDPRTIDTHVKKLRSKLGGKSDCIVTIRGYGYKFSAPGKGQME